MGFEMIIWISVLLVVVTAMFLLLGHVRGSMNEMQTKVQSSMDKMEKTTDKSASKEGTTAKGDSADKVTTSTTQKQETPKQEAKEIQAPTVINNITNNNQKEYKSVVVNEAQSPTTQDSSFLTNLGSNLIAELVVAILFAGLTWFIMDYLKLRKQHKLNREKQILDMKKD